MFKQNMNRFSIRILVITLSLLFSLSMIQDISVVKAATFNISKATAQNGSFTVPAIADSNTTVTVVVFPNYGYSAGNCTVTRNDNGQKHVILGPKMGNSRSFHMPNTDVTIEVQFEPIINLTSGVAATVGITNGANRMILFTPTVSGVYRFQSSNNGTNQTRAYVNATETAHYDLGTGPGNNFSFDLDLFAGYPFVFYASLFDNNQTVSTSYNVTASYLYPNSFNIWAIEKSVAYQGSFTVQNVGIAGDTIWITTSPDSGYIVSEVRAARNDIPNGALTVTGSNNSYSFIMPPADVTVAVDFSYERYPITKSVSYQGTFTVDAFGSPGSTIYINTSPDPGYIVKEVRAARTDIPNGVINVKGSGNTYSFVMPNAEVVVAVDFEYETYKITKSVCYNGSFTVDATGIPGSTYHILTTPSPGYIVKEVRVARTDIPNGVINVSGSGNNYSFVMPNAEVVVAVDFEFETYKITKITPVNGNFIVDTTGVPGSTYWIVTTPNPGYIVDTISVYGRYNKIPVPLINGNGFVMPKYEVDVAVTFKQNLLGITKIPPMNGSFTVASSAPSGSTVTISSISADQGYSIGIVSVLRNDNLQPVPVSGSGASRSFVMPNCPVIVAIAFVPNASGGNIVELATPTVAEVVSGKREAIKFIAPASATYSFSSSQRGKLDPKAYKNATGTASYDDDSGGDQNFKFNKSLVAGEEFVFYAGVYNDVKSANGSYKVTAKYVCPSLTVGSATYTTITLNYGENPKADGYKVYRATIKNGAYKLIATTKETTYLDTGLTNNTTYYYKVRSYQVDSVSGVASYSSYSAIKSAKTKTLSKPTLSVKSKSYNTVDIYCGKVNDADGYQIYRATSRYGKYVLVNKLVGKTDYLDSGLSFNTKYYYKVRAYKVVEGKTIYSNYSATLSVTTQISKPSISSLENKGENGCELKWYPVDGSQGYTVYRYDSVTKAWKKIATLKADVNSYSDSKLVAGRTYKYRICAYRNSNGIRIYSDYSAVWSIVIR